VAGIPCEDHPVITVRPASTAATITIDNGRRRDEVCSMNEVQFTVRVDLARSVSNVALAD
jgi:hypothetical protein